MGVLVAYMSRTGNTEKVAQAIYGEISGDKEIRRLDDVESLEGYDLAFLGFPIEGFGAPKEICEALARLTAGRKVALFCTHAAPEGAPMLEEWLGNCRKAVADADVVGFFDCQGEMSEAVAGHLMQAPDPAMRSWGAGRAHTAGQPDAARLERARAFAREMVG